jgi:hypothetical protein
MASEFGFPAAGELVSSPNQAISGSHIQSFIFDIAKSLPVCYLLAHGKSVLSLGRILLKN